MNYRKIYLVGYKSYLQKNLYFFLKKKKINVKKIQFNKLLKSNINKAIIINLSTDENFFKKKYQKKYDRNFKIAKYFQYRKIVLYLISTRQVYKPLSNINESSKIFPQNNYSKNCLISEKNCKTLLENKLAILRTSNVFGFEIRKKRQSMMSALIMGIKNKKVILDQSYCYKKDILPVILFCKIILILLKKNFYGIINIGSGISLTLLEIYNYINENRETELVIDANKKVKDNSFTFDISKLKKITKIKINKKNILDQLKKIKNEIKKKY